MTLDHLATQIRIKYPDAQVRLKRFSSGVALLDVVLLGTLFVVEHRPDEGYGLSVIKDDEQGFLHGHPITNAILHPIASRLMESLERLSSSAGSRSGEERAGSGRMVI